MVHLPEYPAISTLKLVNIPKQKKEIHSNLFSSQILRRALFNTDDGSRNTKVRINLHESYRKSACALRATANNQKESSEYRSTFRR